MKKRRLKEKITRLHWQVADLQWLLDKARSNRSEGGTDTLSGAASQQDAEALQRIGKVVLKAGLRAEWESASDLAGAVERMSALHEASASKANRLRALVAALEPVIGSAEGVAEAKLLTRIDKAVDDALAWRRANPTLLGQGESKRIDETHSVSIAPDPRKNEPVGAARAAAAMISKSPGVDHQKAISEPPPAGAAGPLQQDHPFVRSTFSPFCNTCRQPKENHPA